MKTQTDPPGPPSDFVLERVAPDLPPVDREETEQGALTAVSGEGTSFLPGFGDAQPAA